MFDEYNIQLALRLIIGSFAALCCDGMRAEVGGGGRAALAWRAKSFEDVLGFLANSLDEMTVNTFSCAEIKWYRWRPVDKRH